MSDNNEEICHCKKVNRTEIISAIKTLRLKTVDEVGKATKAGTGCGGCKRYIQKILNEINK